MIKKPQLKFTAPICALALVLAAYAPASPQDAAARQGLLASLDSIEAEKQDRKRLGKPLDDLETTAARLRDELVEMRAKGATEPAGTGTTAGGKPAGGKKGPSLQALAETLPIKPSGTLDWIIVGTGLVAIVSAIMLVIGIAAGRRKKRKETQVISRRINLAPTDRLPAVPEPRKPGIGAGIDVSAGADAGPADYGPGDQDRAAGLQSLLEQLRQVPPLTPAGKNAPPTPASKPKPPPPADPPPLFVNAPELPPPFKDAKPATPGTPGFNDLVVTASKNGMSDQDISRRYQISVDQVKLILRMSRNS